MSLTTWNKAIILAGFLAAAVCAQNPVCGPNYTAEGTYGCNQFDVTGDSMLSGTYFVREVQIAGLDTYGTSLNTAYSLMGTMTFSINTSSSGTCITGGQSNPSGGTYPVSGGGTYSFTGQEMVSGSTGVTTYTVSGCYDLAANGMLLIEDPLFPAIALQGAVGAAGPMAFLASGRGTVNGDSNSNGNMVLLVGIPVGGTALSGAYYGTYFDLYQASVTSIREAWFPFTADGKGSIAATTVTGIGTDMGNTSITQPLTGAGYSFSGNTGTINLGGVGTSNLISGEQTFYVSTDGSVIVGGTPGDYDIFLGIQALGGTASTASLSGIYVLGGIENNSSVGGENIFHVFNGSTSATGSGTSITHRLLVSSLTGTFFDYTTDTTYAIPASGIFTPGDNYQYALGTHGTFVATGLNALESAMIGMLPPAFSPTGAIWLNPLGVVNAANSAPFTNPVAPNELVTLYGSGLAPDTVPAPAGVFPLPTILDGVQVLVNDDPAPLLYVSPGVIEVLSPSSWYPNNGWNYVTFQVCQGGAAACAAGTGTYSNAVRLFAQNSAPGVFNLTGSATGPAAVRHTSDYSLVNAANPAVPGEIVAIYGTGFGITADQPYIDGSEVTSASPLVSAWRVFMGGVQCDIIPQGFDYAGLAPGFAGLYQINVSVPGGTASGDVPLEVDIIAGYQSPNEAHTIETTINIQ